MQGGWEDGRTHQRSQLRRATSMSDVQATAIGVQGPGLALLIHVGDVV